MKNLSSNEVKSLIDNSDNICLLDVREIWEFEKCHIEGSILIPMQSIPDNLSQLDPQQETIVICHHGIRSRVVANFLEQHGFNQVINLAGGVDAWSHDVDQSMAKY